LNKKYILINFKGVKIYSTSEKRIITYIAKDHSPSLRDELYRCSLLWVDSDTLIIGWADRFKICKIVRKQATGVDNNTTQVLHASKAPATSLASLATIFTPNSLHGTFSSSKDKKDLGTHVQIGFSLI
jgi:hypothetical protein